MAGLTGRTFGDYQLTEQIGASGVAEVYRARPKTAKPGGREAVVKVIYPEFARQPGFIPNFRHIVEMSKKLGAHPHILPLLSSGEDGGYLYLVTPYVADGTLRDWLQKGGRLGASDAGPFFKQLCAALSYAHGLGVTHGDLKPDNVFLFEGRHVLLGDFGLLWDIRQLDMNHRGSGTEAIEYMAPEVFSGQATHLSDIYSLGAIIFATLVGHAPFRGEKPTDVYNAHMGQPVPSLAQAAPGLSPAAIALDGVIQRAMAKRPGDRFQTAALVAQAIETTLQQSAALGVSAPLAPGAGGSPWRQPHVAPSAPAPFGAPAQQAVFGGQAPFAAPGAGPLGAAPAGGAVGAPLAAGALGAGIGGALGGLAGHAPNGMGQPSAPFAPGASVPPGGALARLDFPPLPPSAQVDEQMEQGRHSENVAPPANANPINTVSNANTVNGANNSANLGLAARQQPFTPGAPNLSAPAAPAAGATDLPVTTRVRAPQPFEFPTVRVPAPPSGNMGVNGANGANRANGANGANGAGGRMGFDSASFDEAFDAAFSPQNGQGARNGALADGAGRNSAPSRDSYGAGERRDDWDYSAGMPAANFTPRGPTFTSPASDTDNWRAMGADSGDLADDQDRWQREWLGADAPQRGKSLPDGDGYGADDSYGGYDMGDGYDDSRAYDAYPGVDHTDQMSARDARYGRDDAYDQGYTSGDRRGYDRAAPDDSLSAAWGDGYTGEFTGEFTDARHAQPPHSGDPRDPRSPHFDAPETPFSATELGLPRLTNPVLGELPPSWQELVSSETPAVRGHRQDGYLDDSYSQEQAALAIPWPDPSQAPPMPRRANGPNSMPRGMGGAVAPSNVPPILALQNAQATLDEWGLPKEPGQPRQSAPAGPPRPAGGAMGAPPLPTDDDDGFDRQQVWTKGDKALRPRRRRWAPIILVTLILLVLGELLTLPVIRPDICGSSACMSIRSAVHRVIPSVGAPLTAPNLVVTPSAERLPAIVGVAATSKLIVTNTGTAAAQWQATSSALWLTVAPASGSLAIGATGTLTLTIKPVGVVPGSYKATVTLNARSMSLSVPVTIVVAAGATLAVSPQSLTFTGCGTSSAQNLTIQNTGATPLNATLSPLQANTLLLAGASQASLAVTVAPSGSQTVSVAVDCQAAFAHTYTLSLVSNGGSATVTIHYGG